MHIVIYSTYPLKSTMEAAKAFVEATKNPAPDYVKRLGTYTAYGGKGIKAFTLFEVEKGHEDEGLKEIVKRMVAYYDIEGYEITLEVVLSAEEALPIVGLSM